MVYKVNRELIVRKRENMKILTDTIETINGQLFRLVNGKRCLISNADVSIECYEEHVQVDVIGANKCTIKKNFYNIVLCYDINCEFNPNAAYDIVCDYLREDGIYKRLYLNNLVPVEVTDRMWVFTCKEIDF